MNELIKQTLANLGLMAIGGVSSFLAAKYWFWKSFETHEQSQRDLDLYKLTSKVYELEKQLALVGAQVLPISAAYQAVLVKELTHFHTPEMDALLDKLLQFHVITDEEMNRLKVLLIERENSINGEITEEERDAARILPIVAKRAKLAMSIVNDLKLQVLTVVPEPPLSSFRKK